MREELGGDFRPAFGVVIARRCGELKRGGRGHQRAHAAHGGAADVGERGLQRLAAAGTVDVAYKVAQPVVTPRQHAGNELGGNAGAVVQVGQEVRHVVGGRFAGVEQRQGVARRLEVELARVLHALGLGAKAREHRHLARERGAQRVYGLHAQARGADLELPALGVVARKGRAREVPGHGLVRVVFALGPRRVARRRERCEYALFHFGGGFFGKGNGGNFLGSLDYRQEHQHALDQQLRLPRPGRRLDDERRIRRQRAAAFGEVGDGRVAHGAPSPLSPPPPGGRGTVADARRERLAPLP